MHFLQVSSANRYANAFSEVVCNIGEVVLISKA